MELQTDLSKFYRPITETQKATAREITEGLKPIREGIEKLPQAMQPSGEAPEEEDEDLVGKLAKLFLNRPNPDKKFGIRKESGHHYIGNKHVIVSQNDIVVDGETILGKPGLCELITSKNPQNYNTEDYADYAYLMIKTNALHRDYDPKNPHPRASDSKKWKNILGPPWHNREKYEGKGSLLFRVILSRC